MVQFPQEIFSLIISYNKGSYIQMKQKQLKKELIEDINKIIGDCRGCNDARVMEHPYIENPTSPPFHRPIFATYKISDEWIDGDDYYELIDNWVDGDFSRGYENGEPKIRTYDPNPPPF